MFCVFAIKPNFGASDFHKLKTDLLIEKLNFNIIYHLMS